MAAPANPMTVVKESEHGRSSAAFPRQSIANDKRVAAPLGPGSGEHGGARARVRPHLGCRGAGRTGARAPRRAGIRPGPAPGARFGGSITCPVRHCGPWRLRGFAPASGPLAPSPFAGSMPRQSGARSTLRTSGGLRMTTKGLQPNKAMCGDGASHPEQAPGSPTGLAITPPPCRQQRFYGGGETGGESGIKSNNDAAMKVLAECVGATKDAGGTAFNTGDKHAGGRPELAPREFELAAKPGTKLGPTSEMARVKSNPAPRRPKRRLVPSAELLFCFAQPHHRVHSLRASGEGRAAARLAAGAKGGLGGRREGPAKKSGPFAGEKRGALGEPCAAVSGAQEGKTAGLCMGIRGIRPPAHGGRDGGRRSQIENSGLGTMRMSGGALGRDAIKRHVEGPKQSGHPAARRAEPACPPAAPLAEKGGAAPDPCMGGGNAATAAKKSGSINTGIGINPRHCGAAQRRADEAL